MYEYYELMTDEDFAEMRRQAQKLIDQFNANEKNMIRVQLDKSTVVEIASGKDADRIIKRLMKGKIN
ncbi:hypothetical protein [Dysgonomonas sp. 520]|uniref:hypothetical protein n=1 Tax=Dysgonomonas sp. 520 TaxID=2302931 RepID=UPI0013D1C583|nr:hypothetical protein [Dysgonomonas sp. 520]NDW10931.1 hypothetical protein [Dysgonomonas sp. 520]